VSKTAQKKLDGLTYEEFCHRVKQKGVEPLYLFVGEEEYLHRRALHLLYEMVDEAVRVFNVSIFTVGDASSTGERITAAIDLANQLPMMSARRIVVIRNFELAAESELELVFEYLKRPCPTTVLVFQAESVDQRRKITTAVMKACTRVVLDRLSEQQAAQWAEAYLRRLGCRIEPGALGALIGLVGTDMTRLASEMDKLALSVANCESGGLITQAVVSNLVTRTRSASSFELWDAILERDRKRALSITHRLLEDRTDPLMIVGALAGLYRRMLVAKDLMARKAPAEEVMKATLLYGRRAADFNRRVLRTPRQEIVRGLKRIAEADYRLKSSEATPRLQVEYLVAELTMPAD
jgi:DNA polymerase-3 subunit delta